MASIADYVVNSFNQLPSYCYAEENLVASNCSRTTEESKDASQISPGLNLTSCDNKQLLRPPPGFTPIGEQSSTSNTCTETIQTDIFNPGNPSSIKTPLSADSIEKNTTNPFLNENLSQPMKTNTDISDEVAKQMCMEISRDNIQMQIRLAEMFRDFLSHSSHTKSAFDYFAFQLQLRSVLKIFTEHLMMNDNQSINESNFSRNSTANDIGTPKPPFNSNNEDFVTQKVVSSSTTNPFNDLSYVHKSNGSAATYSSNDFAYKTNTHDVAQSAYHVNWNQADVYDPRVQISSADANTASSMFNYGNATESMCSNSNSNENRPSMMPSNNINCSFPNTSSEFINTRLQYKNENLLSILRDTNPFKHLLTDKIQLLEMQSKPTINYDTIPKSYPISESMQNHTSKMESANTLAMDYNFCGMYKPARSEPRDGFAPVGHSVNVNSSEPNATRIVYEAGPVMYTQKKQVKIDTDQRKPSSIRDSDYNCTQDATYHLGCDEKRQEFVQTANRIDASQFVRDTDKSPFIRTSMSTNLTCLNNNYGIPQTLQNSSTINGEVNHHRSNVIANESQHVSLNAWISSKFQDSLSLHDHNKSSVSSSTLLKPTTLLPREEWSCNSRKSTTRNLNEMTDSNYQLQSNHNNIDRAAYISSWKPFSGQRSVDQRSASSFHCNMSLNKTFLFYRIDLVKGIKIIFHMEESGWLLAHEFTEVFTHFKSLSALTSALEAINITEVFKEIQRSDYPTQFLQLDRYPLNITRDLNNCIISVKLISFSKALEVLCKLKVISCEDVEKPINMNKFAEGSVIHNMLILVSAYNTFRHHN